jgi:SAM-dependent methyltransferase
MSFYKECEHVHELPDIFHYWSNKYLAPDMCRFGFSNPDEFFAYNIKRFMAESTKQRIRIVSIGSGNCDLELKISQKLVQWGLDNFVFECVDINADMLARGSEAASKAGLAESFRFSRDDFNSWKPSGEYEIIMANQSLHHVLNLEGLFDSIQKSLLADGVLLVSDMIGRNGHMRWPEAMRALRPFWNELPKEYRKNRLLNRYEKEYINHDCSDHGFEGIRAQDILPLLIERFNFNFFYPFGNLVFVFIDRPFGHNFDVDADWDKDFIDRVHACDEAGFVNGELKPCSMLAVLTKRKAETVLRHPALTPQHCVRDVAVNGISEPLRPN